MKEVLSEINADFLDDLCEQESEAIIEIISKKIYQKIAIYDDILPIDIIQQVIKAYFEIFSKHKIVKIVDPPTYNDSDDGYKMTYNCRIELVKDEST